MTLRSLALTSLLFLTACGASAPAVPGDSAPAPSTGDGVEVSQPTAGAMVTSPLVVQGRARGMWFSEGFLPVLLFSDNHEVITQAVGMADGEWMTEEFVPFSAELSFQTTAEEGYLLIRKNNPSGLLENEAELKIPVRFK